MNRYTLRFTLLATGITLLGWLAACSTPDQMPPPTADTTLFDAQQQTTQQYAAPANQPLAIEPNQTPAQSLPAVAFPSPDAHAEAVTVNPDVNPATDPAFPLATNTVAGTPPSFPVDAQPADPLALPAPAENAVPAPQESTAQPAPTPAFPSLPRPGGEIVTPAPPPPATPRATTGTNSTDMIPALSALGMELDQFFDLYARISGRTVLRPYVLAGAPQGITLIAQSDWTREEAIYAMDAVLALNNIAMIPVGDKFVKAVPANLAPQEGARVRTNTVPELEADHFVTQVVKLETLKPSELAPLLTTFSKTPNAVTAFDNNQTIVIRDFASNVRRMTEVIERIDVKTDPEYNLEVIPIKYGKVSDLFNTMNGLITGQISSGFGAAGGTGTAAGATAGGAAGFRSGGMGSSFGGSGYGGGYGGGGYGGGYGSSYGGRGRGGYYPQQAVQPVRTAQNTFQDRLRQIVSNAAQEGEVQVLGDARIVPDERSNSLLVFANRTDMAMITNIVSKVDVLLAQVLIEGIILEVKLNDALNLGVSMLQQPQRFGGDFAGGGGINNGQPFLNNITNFSGALPSGFSYFGKVGDDLDLTVTALSRDGSINIVSRPRIQTSHAIPGFFAVGETVPYVTGTYDYGGFVGSGLASRSEIRERPVLLDLQVTPFITPEGLVVMEISQVFDQRGPDVIIDGNPIPVVNTRSAAATLSVRDGDTIMLGGFISENKTKSRSGVPFLKDIPLLGALFRSSSDSNERTELIVLMRATVLESPEQAAIMARTERSGLTGVRKAEEEFEENEKKRRNQLEQRSRW